LFDIAVLQIICYFKIKPTNNLTSQHGNLCALYNYQYNYNNMEWLLYQNL